MFTSSGFLVKHYIFLIFELCLISQDNTIDFLEYVAALNLVLRGKLEHKLKWTFKMYDKDGSGCIDKTELLEIVEVKYQLNYFHIYSSINLQEINYID